MWNMRSEDRLKEWREFRRQIDVLPFEEAISKTVHLWSYAPFVSHHLDRVDPDVWPSPWDILNENKYDDTTKALMMLYTLFLSAHGEGHEFLFAKAQVGLENYNLVYIDQGKYVLNFIFNQVISKEQLGKEFSTIQIVFDAKTQLSTKY